MQADESLRSPTKTIAERLENLEKCCEESKKIILESEKKIDTLIKTLSHDDYPSDGRKKNRSKKKKSRRKRKISIR